LVRAPTIIVALIEVSAAIATISAMP